MLNVIVSTSHAVLKELMASDFDFFDWILTNDLKVHLSRDLIVFQQFLFSSLLGTNTMCSFFRDQTSEVKRISKVLILCVYNYMHMHVNPDNVDIGYSPIKFE